MKSSDGKYFVGIDHVRALATFIVFTWHFIHSTNGYPVQFNNVLSIFPLSLLDEGHTGVAIFMTLSGYLFAKLIGNNNIHYSAFIYNRMLRLAPLLIFVLLVVGGINFYKGDSVFGYAKVILKGFIVPSLPNGGWSITVEFHYYVILPILLWMLRKERLLPVAVIVIFMAFRLYIWNLKGGVQVLSYFTIVGRMDQFILGMLAFNLRSHIKNHHLSVVVMFTFFLLFYYYFDRLGGFYNNPSYPSPSLLWVFIPTIEGLVYGVCMAWYIESFHHSNKNIVSKVFASFGAFSYSIYLIHFFIVFKMAKFINQYIMDISNFYLACLWSVLCYFLMWPIAYLSFKYIESPFLKYRKKYIKTSL